MRVKSFSGNQHVGLEQAVVWLVFYHRELKLKHRKVGKGARYCFNFFYSHLRDIWEGQGGLLV